LAAIRINAELNILTQLQVDREQQSMENRRFIPTFGFFLVLGLTGLTAGCGPTALSTTERAKVDEVIKKERVGRHKELNEDMKTSKQQNGDTQRKQAAGRRGARQGPG
jgi:hypothetical protein